MDSCQQTVDFYKFCTSIFNIVCGPWPFHSAEFFVIRAGNKKWSTFYLYILWKVNILIKEI